MIDPDVPAMEAGSIDRTVGNATRHVVDMKRMTISKELLIKYWYTDGCPGRIAAKHGKTKYTHSDECRRQLRENMTGDDDGQRRLLREYQRQQRKLDKAIETAAQREPGVRQGMIDHDADLEEIERRTPGKQDLYHQYARTSWRLRYCIA